MREFQAVSGLIVDLTPNIPERTERISRTPRKVFLTAVRSLDMGHN